MREDRERLSDILDAIEKIESKASLGKEVFDTDEMIQVWIVYHLQIIGEASANLSNEVQSLAPHIPWPDIVGMRNILVHHYFGIDLEEVWRTAELYLPTLKNNVTRMLNEIKS